VSERRNAFTLGVLVALAISWLAGCSSGGEEATLPQIEAATGDVGALVGTTFDNDSLPTELGGGMVGALRGGLLLNNQPGDDAPVVSMVWKEAAEVVNIAITELDAEKSQDGRTIWNVTSTWQVERDPGTVLAVGETVCVAPAAAFDRQTSALVTIVSNDQNTALGAWVVTKDGPTRFNDIDSLVCERFIP